MPCLEENTLFEFLGHRLDSAARLAVVEHADGCDACRRLIAAAVELHSGGAPAPAAASPGAAASVAAPAPVADDRLLAGRYRLVGLIGRGGMGAVHEAIDTWTGARVAVKELHESIADDAVALRRFSVEAQSVRRIAHPNVVRVLDGGADPVTGAPFLVQELLTGSTLRRRLLDVGRLEAADAIRLLAPALAGLAEAHRAGVVHRDLKP
ncbi:MAG TPA: protein kinase, partial [Kofleriaceae bacterium]|nr:protein kinase [Kofleriaceae bacterium]